MVQMVKKPTRGKAVLDMLLMNGEELVKNV